MAIIVIDRKKNIINRILRIYDNKEFEDEKNKSFSFLQRVNIWLNKNNLNLDAGEFLIFVFILFSLTFLIGLFFKPSLFFSILFLIIIIFLFFIFINIKRRRENVKKENQLEQFLLDLVGYLYGNPNILNCIQMTIEETDYPLRKEFELVLNDTRRGLLLNEALRNMIKRNSSPLIEVVLVGFIAANEKGIDLIGLLKNQIDYIREKRNTEMYIKILSSGPRYTSYLITLIPVISIIIIILINRDILNILFTKFGILILIYIILSNLVGFFIISRMVNYYGGNRIIK